MKRKMADLICERLLMVLAYKIKKGEPEHSAGAPYARLIAFWLSSALPEQWLIDTGIMLMGDGAATSFADFSKWLDEQAGGTAQMGGKRYKISKRHLHLALAEKFEISNDLAICILKQHQR
jgi:hypothetical protein